MLLRLSHCPHSPPRPERKDDMITPGEINRTGTIVIACLLAIILITGVYLPEPVRALLNAAGNIITGGI